VSRCDREPRRTGPASRWTHNGAVRLHYLEARPPAPGTAVLVVPGFGEEAADHFPLVEALSPRHAIVVDLRGRGPSAVPADGYRIEDHIRDAIEDRYRRTVADLRVVRLGEFGHDLSSPDPDRFPATVRSFLDEVEGRTSGGSQ
jgi:pimeloyl-ACP methyl ester carboxylesterase